MANWKATLAKKCVSLKIQPVVYEKSDGELEKVTFFCATEPKGEDKANLIQTLPMTCSYNFTISPKPTTVSALQLLVLSVNGTLSRVMNEINIYLPPESGIIPIEELVNSINDTLAIDEFFKEWTIFVGEEKRKYTLAQAKAMIRFNLAAEKHDFRDRPIGLEDLMDLKIALETSNDVSIFLASI